MSALRQFGARGVWFAASLACFVAATLPGTAAGDRQAERWVRYSVRPSSLSISLPQAWRVVPRSAAAVAALIRRLRADGNYKLAAQYQAILDDPYQRRILTEYAFQAFEWPAPASPITTDVLLRVTTLTQSEARDRTLVPAVAAELVKELRQSGTATVRTMRLKHGPATVIAGTTRLDPSYGKAASGYSIFLMVRDRRLTVLQFRADSQIRASKIPLWSKIANELTFT